MITFYFLTKLVSRVIQVWSIFFKVIFFICAAALWIDLLIIWFFWRLIVVGLYRLISKRTDTPWFPKPKPVLSKLWCKLFQKKKQEVVVEETWFFF